MSYKFLAIPCCILFFALISCGGNNEDQKNQESIESVDSSVTTNNDLSSNDREVSYTLPSALQIAYVFKKSGAMFIPNLLNNKAKASHYNTSNFKRGANFGIYSSDLAYCLFNKKYQESKEYLKACKDMGSFLGLNQAFESENLTQRFDKNIASEDSVIKIVSNIQLKTDVMFEQNKQNYIPVIAFAGAWTESMYIAFEVYSKNKNKKVLISLMEQLILSRTIIKALKVYEEKDAEIPALITAIEKINSEFNNIASVKSAMEKDEEMDFSVMPVTDSELKPIAESIKSLRASIVD